jgi:hypothetical protein
VIATVIRSLKKGARGIKYPTRCRIVDATGGRLGPYPTKTPEVSKPHIGKEGSAELMRDGNVRITLDDGNILWGVECWWVPINEEGEVTY